MEKFLIFDNIHVVVLEARFENKDHLSRRGYLFIPGKLTSIFLNKNTQKRKG
jgi:hypothetical protein